MFVRTGVRLSTILKYAKYAWVLNATPTEESTTTEITHESPSVIVSN